MAEEFALGFGRETVEQLRILAHDVMDVQTGRLGVLDGRKRFERDMEVITYPAGIYNCVCGSDFGHRTADVFIHGVKIYKAWGKNKDFFYLCDSKAEYLTKPDKKRHEKMLFTALVAACAMTACGTKTTETAAAAEEATREIGSSDIAYVQVEAVLAQCDLFLNEGKALQEKTQKAQKSWAQKEQNLQSEAAQLQEKYQKGLITTNDAQAQQQSIEKRVAAYQSSAQKEAQALDEENFVFTNRAQDLLHRAVQDINAGKKYKLIINSTALIDADTTLNITPAVLAKVNELYAADQKNVKK